LQVAQARTGAEQMVAQELVTINSLLEQGKTLEEATRIAAEQRAVAEANVARAIADQIYSLQQQTALSEARMNGTERLEKAEQAYNNAIRQGAKESQARALEQAVYENELQQEKEQRHRTNMGNEKAALEQRNRSWEEFDRQEQEQAAIRTKIITDIEERARAYRQAAEAAEIEAHNVNQVAINNRRAMMDALAFVPTMAAALGGVDQLYQSKQGGYSQFNPAGYVSTWDPLNIQQQKETMEKRARETGGTVEEVRHGVGFGEFVSYRIKKDPFEDAFFANTEATKENTAATQAMTDVLSPFYSSDPRRTHLGFRSFAAGGIMTAHGELPLKQYQGGGVATSPQVAVYGEGSTPEAYVPVPSGRIPVEIRQPANSNQRPVSVTINVMGNADGNTVAALKSTAFQQAQTMRRALG